MTIVEQIHPGYQWGEPFPEEAELEVKKIGNELQILEIQGLLPLYQRDAGPCDLIRRYELARKDLTIGDQRTGKKSPHIRFANANSDEKLINFVRQFGPVVAMDVSNPPEGSVLGSSELTTPLRLMAHQDMEELRNEHLIYRAALSLVTELARPADYDFFRVQGYIAAIAAGISDWPRQWQREQSRSKRQPLWKLSAESLKRIEQLRLGHPDGFLPATVDGRIVICELLNVFRSTVFPNPFELHSSIKHGIRPLLYSILRREFLYPRDVAACANTECREFFEIERAGQRFCRAECSLQQRQRDYWSKRGKKLRTKRLKKRRKAAG